MCIIYGIFWIPSSQEFKIFTYAFTLCQYLHFWESITMVLPWKPVKRSTLEASHGAPPVISKAGNSSDARIGEQATVWSLLTGVLRSYEKQQISSLPLERPTGQSEVGTRRKEHYLGHWLARGGLQTRSSSGITITWELVRNENNWVPSQPTGTSTLF